MTRIFCHFIYFSFFASCCDLDAGAASLKPAAAELV